VTIVQVNSSAAFTPVSSAMSISRPKSPSQKLSVRKQNKWSTKSSSISKTWVKETWRKPYRTFTKSRDNLKFLSKSRSMKSWISKIFKNNPPKQWQTAIHMMTTTSKNAKENPSLITAFLCRKNQSDWRSPSNSFDSIPLSIKTAWKFMKLGENWTSFWWHKKAMILSSRSKNSSCSNWGTR